MRRSRALLVLCSVRSAFSRATNASGFPLSTARSRRSASSKVAEVVFVDEAGRRDAGTRRKVTKRAQLLFAELPVDRLELVVLVFTHLRPPPGATVFRHPSRIRSTS